MKTDRELIELAAKAAGLRINAPRQSERDAVVDPKKASLWLSDGTTGWNPLVHDSDALRLAVKLKMFLDLENCNAANSNDPVTLWFGGGNDEHAGVSHDECDPNAATRRAIVRAAAGVGESMP